VGFSYFLQIFLHHLVIYDISYGQGGGFYIYIYSSICIFGGKKVSFVFKDQTDFIFKGPNVSFVLEGES